MTPSHGTLNRFLLSSDHRRFGSNPRGAVKVSLSVKCMRNGCPPPDRFLECYMNRSKFPSRLNYEGKKIAIVDSKFASSWTAAAVDRYRRQRRSFGNSSI